MVVDSCIADGAADDDDEWSPLLAAVEGEISESVQVVVDLINYINCMKVSFFIG